MAFFNLPDGPVSSIGCSKRAPPAGRFHLIGGILNAPALLGAALGFLLVVVCFPDAARFLGDKIPVYCPKCKKEFQVNVVQLKMTLSNEPDA